MDKSLLVQKLKEFHVDVPNIKAHGVSSIETAEFQAWQEKITKWLKLACPHTATELQAFGELHFHFPRLRRRGEGSDSTDQERYERDCDRVASLLESAIENLEMDLIPGGVIREQPSPSRARPIPCPEGIHIGQAETVVLGDRNVVTIADSITISDFMNALEREIRTKVTNPVEQQGLIDKVKALSGNPTFAQILGQTLGQFLRTTFGG